MSVNSFSAQNPPLTTKGDLYTYSTIPTRLAVGNNGETLVADSSTSTGLRWQGDYAAGRNKIINGDFGIWQRGTSFTTSGVAGQYTSDRWFAQGDAANSTITQQIFTPGTAPVAGYEGQYYLRYVKGGTTANQMFLSQRIEDVRTFAGQTVTLSYWAKASTALTNEPLIQQNFGSGGSSEVYTTTATQGLTTSWARYSVTVAAPSVSGKTIGTSSYVAFWPIRYTGTSNVTIDIWGVQVEAGSIATPFQTATGTIQGELAACQRYYFRASADTAYAAMNATGYLNTTTNALMYVTVPVTMRVAPTAVDFSTLRVGDVADAYTTISNVTLDSVVNQRSMPAINCTVSGATAFRWARLQANNSTNAFIGFSAEL